MNIPFKHFIKHPIKDVFKNTIQNFKAIARYKNYDSNDGRFVNPPNDYRIVFIDEFKEKLNTEVWRLGQEWGQFHPAHLHQYYDVEGKLVYITDEGLSLDLKNEPNVFKKINLEKWQQNEWNLPDEFTIPVGVGLVATKNSWQYGWFESWIKLPKGESYWNAFWLSGVNGWPPEIDIFEGYSNHGPKYDKYLLFDKFLKVENWRIQPNLHYGDIDGGTKDHYRSYNVPIADVTERFVQYVCHWEKDFIRIYYDGLLILECTDDKVLKWFNRNHDKMNIIINHGLHQDKPENPNNSSMVIRSVKVYQK